MTYERKINYLIENGLLETMIKADHLLAELNALPIEAVERQTEIIRQLFGSVGLNPSVGRGFHCDFGRNITVGDNFYAAPNCTMLDFAPIRIGRNCMLGPGVSIYTTFHDLAPARRHETGRAEPVTIGDDVWIGGGATILPGLTIGYGSVIGAASVVTKDVPSGEVWAGNPARFIKKTTTNGTNEHEEISENSCN